MKVSTKFVKLFLLVSVSVVGLGTQTNVAEATRYKVSPIIKWVCEEGHAVGGQIVGYEADPPLPEVIDEFMIEIEGVAYFDLYPEFPVSDGSIFIWLHFWAGQDQWVHDKPHKPSCEVPTETPTLTPTSSETPTPVGTTPAPKLTKTPTRTPVPSLTPTPTPQLTKTPVKTPTRTPVHTPTMTQTPLPTEGKGWNQQDVGLGAFCDIDQDWTLSWKDVTEFPYVQHEIGATFTGYGYKSWQTGHDGFTGRLAFQSRVVTAITSPFTVELVPGVTPISIWEIPTDREIDPILLGTPGQFSLEVGFPDSKTVGVLLSCIGPMPTPLAATPPPPSGGEPESEGEPLWWVVLVAFFAGIALYLGERQARRK